MRESAVSGGVCRWRRWHASTKSVLSIVVLFLLIAIAAIACARDLGDPTAPVGSSSAAISEAASPAVTFDLVYPEGYNIRRAVIAASENLDLGPNDRILALDGAPGAVTSAGVDREKDETKILDRRRVSEPLRRSPL